MNICCDRAPLCRRHAQAHTIHSAVSLFVTALRSVAQRNNIFPSAKWQPHHRFGDASGYNVFVFKSMQSSWFTFTPNVISNGCQTNAIKFSNFDFVQLIFVFCFICVSWRANTTYYLVFDFRESLTLFSSLSLFLCLFLFWAAKMRLWQLTALNNNEANDTVYCAEYGQTIPHSVISVFYVVQGWRWRLIH